MRYWYTAGYTRECQRYPARARGPGSVGSFLHDHVVGRQFEDVGPTTGRMGVGALNLRVAGWVVVLVVLKAVEVLVAFPAGVTAVRLVFFHA